MFAVGASCDGDGEKRGDRGKKRAVRDLGIDGDLGFG